MLKGKASQQIRLVLAAALVPFFVVSASAQTCREVFETPWGESNPTAAQAWGQYKQPNERGLDEYDGIVGVNKIGRRTRSLAKRVPVKGLAIDVGGGRGLAFWQMAAEADVTAVVINTQDPPPEANQSAGLKGRFVYRKGWAQELLKEYEGQADLITDIWGAFSYEADKAMILDLIYAALKPGGRAFILYHPIKTPAQVLRPGGEPIDLDAWLMETYPKIFTSYRSPGPQTQWANIIEIRKPADGSGPRNVGLHMTKGELVEWRNNRLPASEFEPDR
jgi:hypothetical protein